MLYVPKLCEVLRWQNWQVQILSSVSQENRAPDSQFGKFQHLICGISCRKEHKKNNQIVTVCSSVGIFLISVRDCLKPWNLKLNIPSKVAIILLDTIVSTQLLTSLLNHLQSVVSMMLNSSVFHSLTCFTND